MTAAAACFLCLRKFSYFVINRIIMQQQNIAFNLRAHRSICPCVCVFVHACDNGKSVDCVRWNEANERIRTVRECEHEMVKETISVFDRARERTKKKCVLHAKNLFLFSVALAQHTLLFISFLFVSISIPFARIPLACGCAVCRFDVSIPRNLNHEFYGLVLFSWSVDRSATQNNKSKWPQLFFRILASYVAV